MSKISTERGLIEALAAKVHLTEPVVPVPFGVFECFGQVVEHFCEFGCLPDIHSCNDLNLVFDSLACGEVESCLSNAALPEFVLECFHESLQGANCTNLEFVERLIKLTGSSNVSVKGPVEYYQIDGSLRLGEGDHTVSVELFV